MASLTATTIPAEMAITAPGVAYGTADTILLLENVGSVSAYFGPTSDVTAAAGVYSGNTLAPGEKYTHPISLYGGGYTLWFVTAAGTTEIRRNLV